MSIHVYEYIYHCIKKCHNRVNQNSNRSETTERDRVEVGGLVDRYSTYIDYSVVLIVL